jgi:hypothetical protein
MQKTNWIVIVAVVIILGNYFKSYDKAFATMIKDTLVDPSTFVGMAVISAIGFIASFLMGSSGKFVAIAVLMAQVFGTEYFLWFFALDYAAYLLSPTHKCVMIGNRYFGTPLTTYYKALGSWCGILIVTGFIFTFII